ncbi:MAG TPA: 2-oxoglutarate and iron-dependent oxygenase domain-containing protein [Blastocatellia bacterium]|nr:2-oxoglutarate and iron-dependent oxygenase domain-containing protein [Blastocatellia bacterium]
MKEVSPLQIIDAGPLVTGTASRRDVGEQIALACREAGFFYVVGHGVDEDLQLRLENVSRQFFAQDLEAKLEIGMAKGGKAWRGYFPVGRELTSGRPDLKEGIYFGRELSADHPLVRAGTPMHGPNLFPENIPMFRETVLDYLEAMTRLGGALMRGIALSLGLNESYFAERYMSDPLILFRIFNYPVDPSPPNKQEGWGVGEHTDYGVLTILKQDGSGGLQVKSRAGWVDALPLPGSFVCNIGDMLDRMTGGLYRSTPHRVKNSAGNDRLSFPFFFDPDFSAEVKPIELRSRVVDDREERWDRASVHEFNGTYGEYLLGKVSRVFPELHREVL